MTDGLVTFEVENGGTVKAMDLGDTIDALGTGSTRTSIKGEAPAI